MYTYELNHNGEHLGMLVTTLEAEDVEKLYKEFLQSDADDYSIEDFCDWLQENDHDKEAYRHFLDYVIYIP